MKSLKLSLAALLSLVLASPVAATTFEWKSPADGLFGASSSWTPTGVPGANDTANFDLGSAGYQVAFGADATTQLLTISNDTVTFDLGGHTYSVLKGSSSFGGRIRVGVAAGDVGSLTVTNGVLLNVTQSNFSDILGVDNGSKGTLVVDGTAGPVLVDTGLFYVGQDGEGSLRIVGGGHMVSDDAEVARATSSAVGAGKGSVVVDGAGSQWALGDGGPGTSSFILGRTGSATLDVTSGGVVTKNSFVDLLAAYSDGSTAAIKVDGAGSRLNTAELTVGYHGDASLSITNGGQVSTPTNFTMVGYGATSESSVFVSGEGSTWETGVLMVGYNGRANMTIENKAKVESDGFTVGYDAAARGEVLVTGKDSVWDAGARLSGRINAGTVVVADGALFSSGNSNTITSLGRLEIYDATYATATTTNSGVVVDDGTISGNLGNRGLLTGDGVVTGKLTQSAGVLAPGNGPGTLTAGTAQLAGGTFELEINAATGVAGAPVGWDLLHVQGATSVTATSAAPIVVKLISLQPDDEPGLLFDFDPTQPHEWMFVRADGNLTGFDASKFSVDASGFQNDLAGGQFLIQGSAHHLSVVFAVPESPWLVWTVAGLAPVFAFRKRFRARPLARAS